MRLRTDSSRCSPTRSIRARAEPRMPPPVYKAISDAIQSVQLNGQSPEQAAAAASGQIDAFLSGYKGAPIL